MTLMERIEAGRRSLELCAVGWCNFEHLEGALFCGSEGNGHLTDYWQGRLEETPEGTYIGNVGPARGRPEWLRRASFRRDLTGVAA